MPADDPDDAVHVLEQHVATFARSTATTIAAALVERCLAVAVTHPDPANRLQLEIDILAAGANTLLEGANELIDEARAIAAGLPADIPAAAAAGSVPVEPATVLPFDLLLLHLHPSAN